MSELVIQVAKVEKVLEHGNAERLELIHVLGWQLVSGKGNYKEGDKVVFFPPDTVLAPELSDHFGVTQYLSKGRIRAVRLRGEPSFGLAIGVDDGRCDPTWEVGQVVNNAFEGLAWKYEPPIRPQTSDAEVPHPLFTEYTSIENLRNYPDVLVEGEEVAVTEKIHGSSSRVGIIEGEYMIGSHRLRRKMPEEGKTLGNTYYLPLEAKGVRNFLHETSLLGNRQVIVYGEVYGPGIQSFDYGLEPGKGFGYRVFDVLVDGRYCDHDALETLCAIWGLEMVPLLYRGPYSLEKVAELSRGASTVGGKHIREGVVIRPVRERTHEKVGRVIVKYLSDEYLTGSHTDYTEV